MNNNEKERIRRRLAAQHFLENISLDGNKLQLKNLAKKHRSISENSKKLIFFIVSSDIINNLLFCRRKRH